jgi:hypothetical protein
MRRLSYSITSSEPVKDGRLNVFVRVPAIEREIHENSDN